MKVNIINHCKKSYKLDVPKIVKRVFQRIPEKFLVGLEEVHLFDSKEGEYPCIRYVPKKAKHKQPTIEIYRDHSMLKGFSLFSVFLLNFTLLDVINEHIEKYVKPSSEDEEILSKRVNSFKYEWMYLGKWSPVLSILKMGSYLISKFRLCRNIAYSLAKRIVKEK